MNLAFHFITRFAQCGATHSMLQKLVEVPFVIGIENQYNMGLQPLQFCSPQKREPPEVLALIKKKRISHL